MKTHYCRFRPLQEPCSMLKRQVLYCTRPDEGGGGLLELSQIHGGALDGYGTSRADLATRICEILQETDRAAYSKTGRKTSDVKGLTLPPVSQTPSVQG